MNIQLITETEQLAKELLEQLCLAADVVVEMTEEPLVKINITGQKLEGREDENGDPLTGNLGILIGYHGLTLRSLQLMLSLMLNRGREERLQFLVDVDGYQERRENSLKALAKRTMDKARFLKEEVILPPMNSYDRRLIHMRVAEREDMASESIGEEPRRRVVIRPQETS